MNNLTMDYENITLRTKQKSTSLCDLSNSTLLETTTMSLPNSSFNDSIHNVDLTRQIEKLTIELQSAHVEIENMGLENLSLKTELQKCYKSIELYKKIGVTDQITSPITSGKKKNKKRTISREILNARMSISEQQLQENTQEKSNSYEIIKKDTETNNKITEKNSNYKSTKIVASKQLRDYNNRCINLKDRKKVVIIADQQGKNVQECLQKLLGNDYQVTCMWKAGAKINDVLLSDRKYISELSSNDFVILIGGTNDDNPYEFKTNLSSWMNANIHTNIIVTEIPYNKHLNELKLNYELRYIVNNHRKNAMFVDMNYSKLILKGHFFVVNLCRTLLKELLHITYKINFIKYTNEIKQSSANNHTKSCDRSTQTDLSINHEVEKRDECQDPTLETDKCVPTIKNMDQHFDVNKNGDNLFLE